MPVCRRLPPTRLTAINRRRLLAAAGAAALAAIDPGAVAAHSSIGLPGRSCCPVRLGAVALSRIPTLSEAIQGNKQAAAVAAASSLISRATEELHGLAAGINDQGTREATISLLDTPAPTYQLLSPTAGAKEQVRQELLGAGLIPDATTIEGIFPPVPDASQPAQPLWSAPGGSYGGHHAYPGGLVMHEWVNASLAEAYADVYQTAYGIVSAPAAIDPNINLAAPLWHDIHKTVVMQWNPDGSELTEQTIADTGAHHPLSGAEAIVRGMPPDFVVALLSAHNAATSVMETVSAARPILTGYQRLVNYVRAAAIIARVEPIAAGLLRRSEDGTWLLRQDPPRFEGFITHLVDQDYVLTGDTSARMVKALSTIASGWGIDPSGDLARFNLFRNLVFSQASDMRLYGALIAGGVDAVTAIISTEVDLSQLNAQ